MKKRNSWIVGSIVVAAVAFAAGCNKKEETTANVPTVGTPAVKAGTMSKAEDTPMGIHERAVQLGVDGISDEERIRRLTTRKLYEPTK